MLASTVSPNDSHELAREKTNPFESGTILLLLGVLFMTLLAGLSPYMVIFAWFAIAISLILSIRLQVKTWETVPKGRFFLGLQSVVAAVLAVIFAPHTFILIQYVISGMPRYYQY